MKKIKEEYIYLVLLIILGIFMARNSIGLYNTQYSGDASTQFFPNQFIIKESLLKCSIPLWNPFILSGTPFFVKAQTQVISVYSLLNLLIPYPYLAMALNSFIHFIFLGLGIFLVSKELGLENKYAAIASLVCLLSEYIAVGLFFAFFHLMGLTYFIYLLLFLIKGLKSKKWVSYAVLCGIFSSLIVFSGANDIFMFSWLAIGYVLLYNVLGKKLKKRVIKSVLFFVILAIVSGGLCSIRLLPLTDYIPISNRQQSFDFETFLGNRLNLGNSFLLLVEDRELQNFTRHPIKGAGASIGVGIIPSLLILISLFDFKKRKYLFVLGLFILSILLISKSPLNYLLYHFLPLFSKQKHVDKAIFLSLIAMSILAAYGTKKLVGSIKSEKIASISYFVIVLLIVVTSWGFTYDILTKDARPELESLDMMKEISKDTGLFRFKEWESNGIDFGTNYYSIYYGIENIYGIDNLWEIEYLPIFLSVANREPAKFFGILNMKYMSAMEEINISGFSLFKRFDGVFKGCSYTNTEIDDFRKMAACPTYEQYKKSWGPYLYKNNMFLPRAYIVDNSVLVVGEKDAKAQTVYGLMLDNGFKPEKSLIVSGKDSINEYNIEELKRYKTIFLTQGSIDGNSGILLKDYVDNGGRLLPNIVEGKNTLEEKDIIEMWASAEDKMTAIDDNDYISHNFNKYEVKLDGKIDGAFLVVSEKFSMFPGWTAKADGKKVNIERVDGLISAVYLDKPYKSIVFEYKPRMYIIGRTIYIITLLMILSYFVYSFIRRKK